MEGSHGHINVLIIDSNDDDRPYWRRQLTLTSADYHVVEAESGETALQLLKAHSFDCIILELDLPDMTGLELLARVLPRPHLPDVAVVVLTRKIFLTLADLAMRSGAYVCLVKALTSVEDLDQALREAIAVVESIRRDRPL